MINLEITVQPKSIKFLEFKQTLEAIKYDLQKHCMHLTIIEKENTFSILADLKTNEQLSTIINSKEFIVLLGAIKMLCEKSKTFISGSELENKSGDLKDVRPDYKKRIIEIINKK